MQRWLPAISAALALTAATALTALPVAAQDVGRAPNAESIEITVGSGAGASPDIFVRRIGQILNDEGIVTLPIVVQNRTGGAWTVAGNHVVSHPGDEGLLFGIVGTIFTTPIVQGLPSIYDQITPLAMISRIDLVLLVRNDSPIQTFEDLIEAASAEPQAISLAGANVGSTDSIVSSLIEKAGDVDLNYVPFDGGGGAIISAFLGGTVDTIPLPLDEAFPLIQSGDARAIAIFTTERHTSPEYKDVPTATEQGYDVVWSQYFGLAGPPELDPEVAAWWTDKLAQLVETDAWKKAEASTFQVTDFVSGEEVVPAFQDLNDRFTAVLTDLGLAKTAQ